MIKNWFLEENRDDRLQKNRWNIMKELGLTHNTS